MKFLKICTKVAVLACAMMAQLSFATNWSSGQNFIPTDEILQTDYAVRVNETNNYTLYCENSGESFYLPPNAATNREDATCYIHKFEAQNVNGLIFNYFFKPRTIDASKKYSIEDYRASVNSVAILIGEKQEAACLFTGLAMLKYGQGAWETKTSDFTCRSFSKIFAYEVKSRRTQKYAPGAINNGVMNNGVYFSERVVFPRELNEVTLWNNTDSPLSCSFYNDEGKYKVIKIDARNLTSFFAKHDKAYNSNTISAKNLRCEYSKET